MSITAACGRVSRATRPPSAPVPASTTSKPLIDSITIKGAQAQFAEKETGSITVGKAADLVVLDQDLFKITPEEIAGDQVLLTLFAGKEVYRDPSF